MPKPIEITARLQTEGSDQYAVHIGKMVAEVIEHQLEALVASGYNIELIDVIIEH